MNQNKKSKQKKEVRLLKTNARFENPPTNEKNRETI